MKKFYYFLQENPNYPETMIANSKAEVKSLILENIGKDREDAILNIFSEEEFNGGEANGVEFQDPGNFKSGNDFFNSIIKGANKQLVKEAQTQVQNATVVTEVIPNDVPISEPAPVKYFDAGGEHFKMENNKIYKKVWKEVSEKESFRIVSSTTSKPINSEKYKIENLVWEEI